MKKLRQLLIAIGLVCFLTGCASDENTQLTHNQESIDLLTDVLSCEEKKAESILRSLARQNIGNLSSAELTDSESGYKVLIEDEEQKSYILSIDKKYHLYAIQENNGKESYIYREQEDRKSVV